MIAQYIAPKLLRTIAKTISRKRKLSFGEYGRPVNGSLKVQLNLNAKGQAMEKDINIANMQTNHVLVSRIGRIDYTLLFQFFTLQKMPFPMFIFSVFTG